MSGQKATATLPCTVSCYKKTMQLFTIVRFALLFSALHKNAGGMKRFCYLTPKAQYSSIVRSDCFVDKSLLIKSFMELNSRIMVTAPVKFGKTVNMKMLRMFLQNGRRVGGLTDGCRLFKQHNLKIYHDKAFFYKHCGKYPVLHMQFRPMHAGRFYEIFSNFRLVVYRSFIQHRYLLNSSRLDFDDKEEIKCYTQRRGRRRAPKDDVESAMRFLSEMLYTHYNREVILLIDDFDSALLKITLTEFTNRDTADTVHFVRSFLSSLLKDNQYVGRVLINSCLQLSEIILTDSTDCITHLPFLGQHSLAEYYGITSDEVRRKLDELDIVHKYPEVARWYGGYKTSSGSTLYNNWSIMKYLETEVVESYWVKAAGLRFFDKLFMDGHIRMKLDLLLKWKNIRIENTKPISVDDILRLKNVTVQGFFKIETSVHLFLQFISDIGYFKATPEGDATTSIEIPNNEIYHEIRKNFYASFFYRSFEFEPSRKGELSEVIRYLGIGANHTASFAKLRDSVCNLFLGKRMPENDKEFETCIYRTLLTQFWYYNQYSLVKELVCKQTEGLPDLILVIRKDGTAIIIKTKYGEETAEDALDQIVDHHWYKLIDVDDAYKIIVGTIRIYIGIYFDENRYSKVCYLMNSIDKSSKTCV